MSNSNIVQQFQFGFSDIRVVVIDGEPWLVAKDVCEVLSLKNVSDAIDRLDADEKKIFNTNQVANDDSAVTEAVPGSFSDYPVQGTNLLVISESGFYRLVMTSRKPSVKKFQKWVTSEVIPSIRKTGSYAIPEPQRQLPPVRDIIDYASLIVATDWLNSDPILRSLVSQRLAEQLSPGVKAIDAPEQPLGTSQHGKYQVNVYLPSEVSDSIDAFFKKQLVAAV